MLAGAADACDADACDVSCRGALATAEGLRCGAMCAELAADVSQGVAADAPVVAPDD